MLIPGPAESLLNNGTACAKLARDVYRHEALFDTEGWQEVRFFSNGNSQGAVGWHEGHNAAFIVIAGSNDHLDWVNNLDSRKVSLKVAGSDQTIEAHSGILHHADLALDGLRSARVMTHLRGKHLYIAGHSLGGAVAEVLPLLDVRLRPQQIHTFGSPRWCSSGDALSYPFTTIHWRRPEDLVPDVPLHLSFKSLRLMSQVGGFSHVRGNDAYLNGGAIPETDHILRRIRRFRRYRRAMMLAAVCAAPWRWTPVRTKLRMLEALNAEAATDHNVGSYHLLLDGHRRRNGGE